MIYGGIFLLNKVFFKQDFSNVPTIQAVTNSAFTFGVQEHTSHPSTVEDFIPILGQQLKIYNEIAPTLWYNNALVNQTLFVEQIRGNKFWKIAPDGTVTILSKKEFMNYSEEYGFSRNAYVNGFSPYDNGMYLAIADDDVANVLNWQQYLHLGTYDAMITFAHEIFHSEEQIKWQSADDIPNIDRDEFMENVAARGKRELLQKQLLRAISEPSHPQLVLEALATYEDWKIQFPEDYKNSITFDRLEGTAYYYEIVSSLYSGYPDQIKSKEDLHNAIALLATREDIYVDYGLVAEGYNVGGFACMLLDRFVDGWQNQLMNDPEATPIEMLYQHFKGEILPEPKQLTQNDIDAVSEKIQGKENVNPMIFRFLYDILF
jgi:hypothetical protein